MTQEISPGRYRGLKTTSLSEADVFGIVAFDQRGSYQRMLPDNTPFDELVQIKVDIIGALSNYASAILTDANYGLLPAMQMNGKSGLMMALDESGYSGDSTYRKPKFLDTWTPEKIREIGANAVKLLIYYNPRASQLSDELDELIKQVVSDCHGLGLPVFLEPLSYSIDKNIKKESAAFAGMRSDIVVETARRLSQTGADVLKMEFPLDLQFNQDHNEWRKQCRRLSEASVVPWVLLSAGVDFEEFVPQVHIACENGASGFLAGRAIWKEAATMSPDQRKTFMAGTATERLRKLLDISLEKARPWTDFYSFGPVPFDWFDHQ
jgi:tagatose 1,6-diphosphate aldolase